MARSRARPEGLAARGSPRRGSVAPAPRTAPGVGEVLRLIRTGAAVTRGELMARTGLSRSTLTQRLEQLAAHGLILEAGAGTSTRGRPPSTLAFNPDAGVILSAGMGITHCWLGVTDLAGTLLAELTADHETAASPDATLRWLEERFRALLEQAGRDQGELMAIGAGIPAPVEHATGTPVNPPLMPRWDGYPVAETLRTVFDVPVLVDNDVNTMVWGEHFSHWPDTEHMVFIKVGSGIGLGIVSDGHIHRGADGAAGDIGHLPVAAADGIRCRCGNLGCLEAIASGSAMARTLAAEGHETQGSRDVVRLARAGDVRVTSLIRDSGRLIGQALVSTVNLLNPRVIVIGGDVAHADHLLLAGVREEIYARSLPLATRHLHIVRSQLDDRAGVIGAALMASEHVLAPEMVDRMVAGVQPSPA